MSVTVGICAYNEAMNIGNLLENILEEQELPPNSEVMVICSGCTDDTVEIVQKYARKDGRIRVLLEKERKGKASAINLVLEKAKGESIIFISADTIPHKGCFFRLISRMKDQEVGIVCGKPKPVNSTRSMTGRIVHILWDFHDHVFDQFSKNGNARHASEIFCVRRGIVNAIPINIINDDAYMAIAAKKDGFSVEYEADSSVSIRGPETLTDYFRQRRRVICGHYQIKKMTGDLSQYSLLFSNPFSKVSAELLLWMIKQFDILDLAAFLSMEVLSTAMAISDNVRKKPHHKWRIATSTKRVG